MVPAIIDLSLSSDDDSPQLPPQDLASRNDGKSVYASEFKDLSDGLESIENYEASSKRRKTSHLMYRNPIEYPHPGLGASQTSPSYQIDETRPAQLYSPMALTSSPNSLAELTTVTMPVRPASSIGEHLASDDSFPGFLEPRETTRLSQRTTTLLESINGNAVKSRNEKGKGNGKGKTTVSKATKIGPASSIGSVPRARLPVDIADSGDHIPGLRIENGECCFQDRIPPMSISTPMMDTPTTVPLMVPPAQNVQENARPKKTNTAEAQAERAAKAEKKKAEKAEKETQKLREQAIAQVNQSKSDKRIQSLDMIVDLPSSITGGPIDVHIREFLKRLNIHSATHDSLAPGVVTWRRQVRAAFNEVLGHWEPIPSLIQEEKHAVCLLSSQDFANLLAPACSANGATLEAHVKTFKSHYPGYRFIYMIEGVETLLRKSRNSKIRAFQAAVSAQLISNGEAASSAPAGRKKTPTIPPIDEDLIEDALLDLQVKHGCLIQETRSAIDTAEAIVALTQQISLIPSRAHGPSTEATFCMDAGQVRTGVDKYDTFLKMLQENVRVTAPIANGIAIEYPDVVSLARAFREHGPLILADIEKSANKNGSVSMGRIGPALSRRLCKIFTETNPASMDI